jgi:hypothetical protein
MMHDVAEDLAGPDRQHIPLVRRTAVRAHRPGRVAQRTAVAAALDPQLADGRAVPEECGIGGDHRPHSRAEGRARRQVVGPRDWLACRRAELQDPEVHRRDGLIADVPGTAGRDEPALAKRRPLRAGHIHEASADRQLLAVPHIPVINLIAVGRDDRGVPGVIEYLGHLAKGITGVADAVQPWHRPDLDHRRRRDQPAVHRLGGRRGYGIDRVGVPDRFHPVPDHRQVHRVTRLAWAALTSHSGPFGHCADHGCGSVLRRPRVRRVCVRTCRRAALIDDPALPFAKLSKPRPTASKPPGGFRLRGKAPAATAALDAEWVTGQDNALAGSGRADLRQLDSPQDCRSRTRRSDKLSYRV